MVLKHLLYRVMDTLSYTTVPLSHSGRRRRQRWMWTRRRCYRTSWWEL